MRTIFRRYVWRVTIGSVIAFSAVFMIYNCINYLSPESKFLRALEWAASEVDRKHNLSPASVAVKAARCCQTSSSQEFVERVSIDIITGDRERGSYRLVAFLVLWDAVSGLSPNGVVRLKQCASDPRTSEELRTDIRGLLDVHGIP